MKTVKLSDVCKIINGGTPKTVIREYWDGEILWITPKDLGKIKSTSTDKTERTITKLGLDNSSAKLVPKQSIILSTRAPIGYLVINTKPMSFNQGCKGIIPGDSVNVGYLYHYLKHSKRILNELGTGTTFPELSMTTLSNFEILLPSLNEQNKIVEKLDRAFGKINQAIELTQKNLENVREMFNRSLEISLAYKEGWSLKTFGEIAELKQGLAINAKTKHLLVETSSLPLLRIKDLKNNYFSQYVDEEKCPESVKVNEGDVLYTRTGQVGLVYRGFSGVLHNNSFKITPDSSITNDYLFWYLQNPSFKEKIIGLASRTAQPDITHKIFKTQMISFPKSIKSQQEIYSNIQKVFDNTQRLQKLYSDKLVKLEALKQSMLEEAFQGGAKV